VPTEVRYAARFTGPTLFERGRTNRIECRVYRAGKLAVPTSGTVTVYDATGTVVVDAASVGVSDGFAAYDTPTLASSTYGEGWRVAWSLLMPDGTVHLFRNEAMLVRCALAPPATEADLYQRVSGLDPSGPAPITTLKDYTPYGDAAWATICQRLISKGRRPDLIASPSALYEPYVLLWLANVFDDLATRLNAAYLERAQSYRSQFETAWGGTVLALSYVEDNAIDTSTREPAQGPVWLAGRGQRSPRGLR
jgi:hypothetical protein